MALCPCTLYEYFGGVAKILVPDNCKIAVIHNGDGNDYANKRVVEVPASLDARFHRTRILNKFILKER